MKNFRRQWSLNHIHTVTTILKSQTDIGNEEIDLREKNKLSWQNTWKSRKFAADIKEKLGNHEVALRGVISLIHLPFLINRMETMPRSYQQSAT